MRREYDYTARARNLSLSYPRLTYLSIQVTFWIGAYLLLSFVLNLTYRSVSGLGGFAFQMPLLHSMVIALSSGTIYGCASGMIELWLARGYLRNKPLGVIIALQAVSSWIALVILVLVNRFILWDTMIVPYVFGGKSPLDANSWRHIYYIVLIYTFMMTFVISFINQMNRQFGHGVLVPLLLGKYRRPKEERRIFMFMDMKASTTHAERLGHLPYSALVRDCFLDINRALSRRHAEIYQYVGDEIVLSWPLTEGLQDNTCIEFYFACRQQLQERREYYTTTYGFLPEFKAGLHLGVVTAVEVGEIKRSIAYHGDTLNTASRIQALCGTYNESLLISEDLRAAAGPGDGFEVRSLGPASLKGRDRPVELFGISKRG